jgi:hypothetical protein
MLKKEKEFDFKIERKNQNFIRLTVGENIGFEYIVEKFLPEGNNTKIIRIICNQNKTAEMRTLHFGKPKTEQLEEFKETFSKIISYCNKSGQITNHSNKYVVVRDFHKMVFSTRDWLATTRMDFSKHKVKTNTVNKIMQDSTVNVNSIKKTVKSIIQNSVSENDKKYLDTNDNLYSFSRTENIDDEIKKCFCIDSSNLEEIFNNLERLHDTGFLPDALLMDFKIYDSCEIDVELWHTSTERNPNDTPYPKVKKLKRNVPLVKLDKIIPIEMKTIPITNSSFTANQKKFIKYVHDDKDDVLKPIILHIPLENIFTSKDCLITEYSITKESHE